MKTVTQLIAFTILALSLAACGSPQTVQNSSAPDAPVVASADANAPSQITNYFVRSTCDSRLKEGAIRMNNLDVAEAYSARNGNPTKTNAELSDFGLPRGPRNPIGMEQVGQKAESARKCVVRSTRTTPDSTQASASTEYRFAQPGTLTTTQYDCYEGQAFQCSVTFQELPAGQLTEVFSVARPL